MHVVPHAAPLHAKPLQDVEPPGWHTAKPSQAGAAIATPLLQVALPQTVPIAFAAPLMQVVAPVLQLVTPKRQAGSGLVLHDWPAVQVMQLPPGLSQTRLTPQVAPAGFGVPLLQTLTPVLQDVTPLKHTLGLVMQLVPAVHGTHVAIESHTRFEPHGVPASFAEPSVQVGAPVAHELMPLAQMFGLPEQVTPAVQATQLPVPLHTWLVPHAMPAPLLLPSTQVWLPVLHAVVPFLQVFGLPAHVIPAVHATHWFEMLHTRLLPHGVPAPRAEASTQVVVPVAHEVVPKKHAAFGLPAQPWPAVHMPQKPLPSHTWLAPHVVPPGLLPVSTHVWAPVAHEVAPFLQLFGLVVQVDPAVHPTHMPVASHTRLVPHPVPAERWVSFTHV